MQAFSCLWTLVYVKYCHESFKKPERPAYPNRKPRGGVFKSFLNVLIHICLIDLSILINWMSPFVI